MTKNLPQDRFSTHTHRITMLISYLMIITFILRRKNDMVAGTNVSLLLAGLALFILLFATEPLLSARIKSYQWVYFSTQLVLVEALGLVRIYQDTWAILFIILGFQVARRCSRKEALMWFGLFITALLVTLSVEFGFVSGIGRALAYIIIGVLLISYDIQYSQHEDALAESQVLLAEVQEAHQKLEEYMEQASELAAVQERNRMLQELHDSVGQRIFAIQLAAESTRLMLVKDPTRAMSQLEDLHIQTQSALGQMRLLIEQWRPS